MWMLAISHQHLLIPFHRTRVIETKWYLYYIILLKDFINRILEKNEDNLIAKSHNAKKVTPKTRKRKKSSQDGDEKIKVISAKLLKIQKRNKKLAKMYFNQDH